MYWCDMHLQELLFNCRQKVMVDGATSEWISIVSSIPQGSVLGPLLFILYTREMFELVENTTGNPQFTLLMYPACPAYQSKFRTNGINYNESSKMKSLFIITDCIYFSQVFACWYNLYNHRYTCWFDVYDYGNILYTR